MNHQLDFQYFQAVIFLKKKKDGDCPSQWILNANSQREQAILYSTSREDGYELKTRS